MFTFNQCSISAYISTKNLSQKEKVYKLLLWVFLEKMFFSVEGTANIGGDAHFVLKLGGVDVMENNYEDLRNASIILFVSSLFQTFLTDIVFVM